MKHKISVFEKLIDDSIRRVLKDYQPRTLFAPAEYILSLGGKRLRPLLTLMAADLFGKNPEEVLDAALAVEIFHNFSLVHDDLMDNADLRRGYPTVHKKWSENSAILSGDALVIEAYRYIAKVPVDVLPDILELFSTTAMEICEGQQYDMDFEQRLDVREEEYIEMIRLKTAVLIGCALKIGAIVAGAPVEDTDLLYEFGINIGLAFQLKDDLLDVYGNPETFGKKIGGDILCNKKTFLLIRCLKNASDRQRAELNRWLTATEYDPDEKIKFVKNIYDELNLKFVVENLIEKYYLASLDCLSLINIPDDQKRDLISLSENLMYREK
ncbi:Trans-Isoprenyl Diphosphate Synthases [Proteiniphilum saccharofermentans]|uniref:Trans-Isoprenyl Diphosphate Synthases n=1 Tax=Proteiniphilum saccharofermentans TaxID=1642647 RepID=A0A1R3T117_9BACT|nr:polyprenyl synthetase family protein [Proteiniphilum saccharofermentans]SCD19829.1 Trans-Isoprenyl Diphosphate Synthases [Proteiniphilum saccharofermentans]SDZ91392.1 geranylgeranyl diphosphate synthase, type II [Porphyromonadaceae bacterium KH3R12]